MSGNYIYSYRSKSLDGRYLINITTGAESVPLAYKNKSSANIFHLVSVPANTSIVFLLECQFDVLFPQTLDIEINQVGEYCRFEFEKVHEGVIPEFPSATSGYSVDNSLYPQLQDHEGISKLGGANMESASYVGEYWYENTGSTHATYKLDELTGVDNFILELDMRIGYYHAPQIGFDFLNGAIHHTYPFLEGYQAGDYWGFGIVNSQSAGYNTIKWNNGHTGGNDSELPSSERSTNINNTPVIVRWEYLRGDKITLQVFKDGLVELEKVLTPTWYTDNKEIALCFTESGVTGSQDSRIRNIKIEKL